MADSVAIDCAILSPSEDNVCVSVRTRISWIQSVRTTTATSNCDPLLLSEIPAFNHFIEKEEKND